MRMRLAGLLAGLVVAAGAVLTGASPAMAVPAGNDAVHTTADKVDIMFYNDGWYYAYADVWARDNSWNQVDHDWSGTFGHTGHKWLHISPDADKLEMLVRYDPTGETIHRQVIDDWRNYPKQCGNGQHLTIYVGGTWHNANHYDIHCSKWGT
jgi:hypothetical protein